MSATMQRWTRYLIRNQTCISPSLLASIGTESKTILSQHAFYHVDCEQNGDSDVLAIIISKTQYAEVSGDNPLRKHNIRAKKEMEFGLFRMKADMTVP